jgi:amino acid transporter
VTRTEASPGGKPIAAAATTAHPELFARQSSGLVREIGFKDALAMNLIIVAPAFAYIFFGLALGLFPRTELILPILAAGVISLFLGCVYGQLAAAMPRSGGDYVFMSRVVHPAMGALVGGAFLVAFFLSVGFGALAFAQVSFPFFLRATGDATGIGGLTTFAGTVMSHTGSFVLATAAVVVGGAIAASGVRGATRSIFYGFLLMLAAILAIVGYFLFTSRSGFVHAFDKASAAPNAYAAVKTAARHQGLPASTSLSDMWLATPFFMLAYVGFTFAVYPGGEIKRAGTTVLRAVVTALLLAIVVLLVMWLSLRKIAGLDFLRSISFLSTANPDGYGHISSVVPQGQELWLLVAKDPVSKIVAGAGLAFGALVQVVAYLFIVSRLIFAMSFDRMLPTKLADVSERTHSPLIAIVVSMALSMVFVYLGSYTTALTDIFRNSILMFIVVFFLTSIGATLMPYLRRDLYDASPALFGRSWAGLPPITVIGAISTVLLGIVIVMTVTHDQISGGFTTVSVITLLVTFGLGPVVYFVSRLYSRTRGIDLRLAMTELPPE